MRTGLLATIALAFAIAAWAPGAGATGEPGSGCESEVVTVAVECPPVATDVDSVQATRRAILVVVEVSSTARVQVFGQVSWQVRQPDGSNRGLSQGITAGAPRTISRGAPTTFRVALGRTVSRRLNRIAPRQSLRAQVTVRTTDLAGRERDRRLTVTLPGRDRG
jgi:hypothetical protein